jgi:hypothetical protein
VLGSSGEIIDKPGHRAKDRLLYIPAPELTAAKALNVVVIDDVVKARDFLMDELLGDFAWVDNDNASKANALALLLTPFVREFIGDHPTPLFAIVAPEVGTGKTLLAQAALTPACGVVGVTPEIGHDEEMRKGLTAQLLSGTPAIIFDNVSKKLVSGPLAAAISTGNWKDRRLGKTEMLELPVRNVWVATGNNLDLGDDHMRRTVPIFLDPGEERPSDRPKTSFKHPDLLSWAREKRSELVSAALTLVQHWADGFVEVDDSGAFIRVDSESHEPGDPDYSPQLTPADRTLGSFERWGDVVGGILAAADVKGFLENRDRLGGLNTSREDDVIFLSAWHVLGRPSLEARELLALCRYGSEETLHDDLPEELQRNDLDARTLGKEHRGASYGGFKVVMEKSGPKGRRKWSVVGPESHSPTQPPLTERL